MRDSGNEYFVPCIREKNRRIGCPGRCACVDIPGDRDPLRFLQATHPYEPSSAVASRLTWNTSIDFCAQNLPVTAFAAFLERAFPGQVFVPAAKVYATVSRHVDGETLADVAASIGLIARGAQ